MHRCKQQRQHTFFRQSHMLRETDSLSQSLFAPISSPNSPKSPSPPSGHLLGGFPSTPGGSFSCRIEPLSSCCIASPFHLCLFPLPSLSPLFRIMSSAAPVVAQSAFQKFLNHPAGTNALLLCLKGMNQQKNPFFPSIHAGDLGHRSFQLDGTTSRLDNPLQLCAARFILT